MKKILQNIYVLVPLVLGLITALKVVSLGEISRLGSDSIIHVYKIELLIEQMKQQPILFWGSWDWNWFLGYPFLRVYSPLYYFLVALISRAANVSVTFSMELLYLIVYPLSALAAYFLSYELTKDKILSIVGVSVYFSCPAIVEEITSNGSIPRLPLYLLMPLSLLFMEKLTDDNGKNVKFFVALVLSLSALILTHFQYGLILVPHLVLIMLLKRLFVKRFDVKAFLVIPLSVLISSVSTFPLVYYIYTEGQVWSSAAPTIPFSTPLKSLYFFSGKGIGALTFFMIITSFVFLCISIFNRKKTGSTWKSNRYLPYVVSAAVSLCQFYAIYVTGRISSALNVISGKHAVFAMFFVSPVIASYVVTEFKRMSASKGLYSSNNRTMSKSFFKSRNFWTSVMVILALISILLTYHWFQPPPARWLEAYEAINDSALASANSWFRAETIPRHPSQMVMQMESGIPTLQGWFGKAGAKENKILLQLNHFDIAHEDPTLVEKLFHDPNYDPDPTIRALRIFNVKYVMVDEADPVSSSPIKETTSRIVSSFNRSNLVKPVYADGGIFVFELQETYQIMASINAFVMSDENLTSFYQVISNKSFSPSLGIFLSQSTTVEGMTFKEWDGSFENDGYVNATINEIETNSMSIKFHLTVDRDCFVTIPISYSSFLKVEIDNSEVKMLKALPALVSVQVSAGTHRITVSRVVAPLEVGSLAVSIITLICSIALLPICRLKKKMPTQTSLQAHVSRSKTYTHGGNNTRNEILKRHRLPKSDRENIYNCE